MMGLGRTAGFCMMLGVLTLSGLVARAAPPLVDAAAVALRAGNASNAIALANQALADTSLTPRDRARVLIDRGLAHEMLGERDGALIDFTDAINARILPPEEQARAFYDRGVTLDELSRTDDAINDYSAAIRLSPRFAAALNNRGNAYRRQGKFDAAKADYNASIAAGNSHPEYPNFGLGQIAETLGQRDVARGHYQAAINANPQFSLAVERLAVLNVAAGTGPITLRPPAGQGRVQLRPPASALPPVTVTPPGEQPITLRPPGQAPLQLRPPQPRANRRIAAPPPTSPGEPLLKPALSEPGMAGGSSIQLGAWRNEAEAADAWNRANTAGGNLLAGLSPRVVAVDLPGKGRYYRLRAGPVPPQNAPSLCAALQARGLECVVAKD